MKIFNGPSSANHGFFLLDQHEEDHGGTTTRAEAAIMTPQSA
ncbi:MAG: hypothetical protein ACLSAF_23195 [Intestinimonas sp.]